MPLSFDDATDHDLVKWASGTPGSIWSASRFAN